MRCEEYLQLLSTLPVEELVDGRSGDHLGSCAECNRATKVVVERERNMAMALAGMSSHVQPLDMARSTFALERRHRMGRLYIAGLIALLLTIGFVVVNRTVIPLEAKFTQTFTPKCLSRRHLADLIARYAYSPTMTVSMQPGSSLLTVYGTNEDLVEVRAVVSRFDNPDMSSCLVPEPGAPKPGSVTP